VNGYTLRSIAKKTFRSIPITALYNLTADLIINKQAFSNNF